MRYGQNKIKYVYKRNLSNLPQNIGNGSAFGCGNGDGGADSGGDGGLGSDSCGDASSDGDGGVVVMVVWW